MMRHRNVDILRRAKWTVFVRTFLFLQVKTHVWPVTLTGKSPRMVFCEWAKRWCPIDATNWDQQLLRHSHTGY